MSQKNPSTKLLILQPTSFCNINCTYCYLPDRHVKNKMSVLTYQKILENLEKSRLLDDSMTVCWHAGEPLVMPYEFYQTCFEITRKFEKENLEIHQNIQTNAILVNQKFCNLFKEYKARIGVSLDGPEFIHDIKRKFRNGKGSHAATIKGIKLLQDNNISVSAICVLSSESLDYPDEIYSHFLENGIYRIGLNIEEAEGTHQESSINNAHTEKYEKFLYRFLELAAIDNQVELREFNMIEDILKTNKNIIINSQSNPYEIVNVSTNGDFTTFSPELLSQDSLEYSNFVLGNVYNDLIIESAKSAKFNKMYGDILAGVKKCSEECDYFGLCGGGAPSNKYYENGTFDSSETQYCRFNKKILVDVYLDFMANRVSNSQNNQVQFQ
jgi:uncharacterized protein